MKQSTIQWHLARDNQEKLAKFCNKQRLHQSQYGDVYNVGENENYFQMMYQFDNDGFIRAELRAGDVKGYTIADHFQVVDYSLGN
jgi:hypothetical protein